MSTKQYGLINLKTIKKSLVTAKPNIFGDDSDDESPAASVGESILRESMKAKMKKQTQIEVQKALAEDPTVYEYDSIFDEMDKKKKLEKEDVKKQKDAKERKPKYIGALMKSAELRKKEYERREERKVQKEREKEGSEFADKESFVTSAYKKKMLELQEQEERERYDAAVEAATDVTKQKDLSGFYRHLMRQTMGEEKGQNENDEEKPDSSKANESLNSDDYRSVKLESSRREHDDSDRKQDDDKKRRSNDKSSKETSKEHRRSGKERSPEADKEIILKEEEKHDVSPTRVEEEEKTPPPVEKQEEAKPKADPYLKRNSENTVSDARERFLARKKSKMS